MLFLAGAVLLGGALSRIDTDARRWSAVALLALAGMSLSCVSIVRRRIPVRPAVRNLACAVGGLLVVGLLALRYHIAREVVPVVPDSDHELRAAYAHWLAITPWLTAALAYALLSVGLLPASKTAPPETPGAAEEGADTAPEEAADGGSPDSDSR